MSIPYCIRKKFRNQHDWDVLRTRKKVKTLMEGENLKSEKCHDILHINLETWREFNRALVSIWNGIIRKNDAELSGYKRHNRKITKLQWIRSQVLG